MFYHLDTIPIWDAMKNATSCPLCLLREKIEQQDVERFLGGSVMEPSFRIKVNAKGFCSRHHEMLYTQKNRLGHALLLQSRLITVREQIASLLSESSKTVKGGIFKADKTGTLLETEKKIKEKMSTCIICDSIEENMVRYTKTWLHLYKTDASFREAFEASKGVCLQDITLLLFLANAHLSGELLKTLLHTLNDLTKRELDQLQGDIDGFCLQFDYRNRDKPLGTSRGSIERTVNYLRGKTFKEEPRPSPTPSTSK